MRPSRLLLICIVVATMVAAIAVCGCGKKDADKTAAGGPGMGGPGGGMGGPPGGGMGGPGGGAPGAAAGGGTGAAPAGEAPGAAPAAGATTAPPGATAKDGINVKHSGNYDQALAIFEANLQSNPKDALALWGKAWIQAERGSTNGDTAMKAEAVKTFNQFLAVSKDRAKTREARAAVKRLGG